mgnify:CR=1 FL=1
MKYVDEFRNKNKIQKLGRMIREIAPSRDINLMEVCGTHTQSFFRFGLDKILPPQIKLIAGPGCPVCVSTQGFIDSAIALAGTKDMVILSFGDMLRVPGTSSTLEKERARSGNIRVVYSPLDCLSIARLNPRKRIVFLAVGFETTASTIAFAISQAKKEKLKNLFFLSSLKLIPPAMEYLVRDKRLRLDGFLCPGHVSVIIGTKAYEFLVKKYGIGCCVAGFEPSDILEGIYALLRQIASKKPGLDNQYERAVTFSGNRKALDMMKWVFKVEDASWRGLGSIPKSGLALREEFSGLDAVKEFSLKIKDRSAGRSLGCRCGDVLKGLISPKACPLFAKICSPDNPVGPCMVSSEGACYAHYKYR